ncbi:hypothetical protein BY457_102240 [Marinilabilia salmonicolor]|jgi:hypothetical protein|uniref:hypothetical protein n=1 Tax=Marinilabilia salmonicolor TaxID=989 RepID=UPI000D05BB91|nr:hypothetical protein [Marinilabilia salmonicolor]PRZ01832.1 hypothetical protein BY457_102240 [Marinilabilia salmonicolor]
MPYRRLPNTDQARLRALKTAQSKGAQLPPMELAFSQKSLFDIKAFVPQYEQAIQQYQFSRDRQAKFGKSLSEHFKLSRMYLSHFLQVVNMAITRGELKPDVRSFYGLDRETKAIPDINTEQQLLEWGKKVIQGEDKRMSQGGSRVFNPTIAMVKMRFEKFQENYDFHKDLLKTSQKMHEKVTQERETADQLIVKIWNEVEATFNNLEPDQKRKKASEYGVVYIYRPSEKEPPE